MHLHAEDFEINGQERQSETDTEKTASAAPTANAHSIELNANKYRIYHNGPFGR